MNEQSNERVSISWKVRVAVACTDSIEIIWTTSRSNVIDAKTDSVAFRSDLRDSTTTNNPSNLL